MKHCIRSLCRWAPVLTAAFALTGCLNLKPAQDPTRHFVLTSLVVAPDPSPVAASAPAFGLGSVRMSAYLQNSSLAARKGEDEIVYLEDYQWAEQLDDGVDRIIALNLRQLLGNDKIYLKVWLRETVDYEIDLDLSRFEPDATGKVTLIIHWNITLPGGVTVVDSGRTLVDTQGPRPDLDPAGSAHAMSQALAEFSLQLSERLKTLPRTRPQP